MEGLNYVDNAYFLTHSYSDMQAKLNILEYEVTLVGLQFNVQKKKAMQIGTSNNTPYNVQTEAILCGRSLLFGKHCH